MLLRALRARSSIHFAARPYMMAVRRVPKACGPETIGDRPPAPASICGRFRYPTPSPTTSRKSCPWPRRNPPPPPTIKTASRARPAPICCSTSTIRSTGGPGGRRRWPRRSRAASRSCCRSAMPPATGATSWRTRASRTPAPRAVMNELFVNIKVDREERPGHRPDLHVGAASSGRAGRLAADHVPDARGRAGLGRHLLSRRPRATAGRPSSTCCARSRGCFARSRTRSAQNRDALMAAAGGAGAAGRQGRSIGAAELDASPRAARRRVRSDQRRPARRAEISATRAFYELLWRAGLRTGDARFFDAGRAHARAHLRGRHLRSSRRRLLALFGRRALAGAAFREDALRQRAAARAAGAGLRSAPASRCSASARARRSAGSRAR